MARPTATQSPTIDGIVEDAIDALDAITERGVQRILEINRSYEEIGTVETADLRASVRSHVESVLRCLREGRLLTEEELESRRQLGHRRAQQGMPVTVVMRAFRVGYVVLWEELLGIASRRGPRDESVLLQSASLVWTTLDQISSAVAEGHREAVERVEVDLRRLALSLVENLRRLPVDTDDTGRLARELGLAPDGEFLVGVFTGTTTRPTGLVVEGPQGSVVIQQPDATAGPAEQSLATQLISDGAEHVGVGLVQCGLDGAATSLRQAEQALAVSRRRGVAVTFRDEWLVCLAIDQLPDVTGVLGPAIELLRRDENMRATLAAYLNANGQLAAAGSALYVHPNTVAYRLGRLASRTGLDPRNGEPSAWLALRLAELPA
jgi:DNA-binding PucR family transcriptional regulator